MIEPIYNWLREYLSLTDMTGPLPDYEWFCLECEEAEMSREAMGCWQTMEQGKNGKGCIESLHKIVEIFLALLLKEAGCHPSPGIYISAWVRQAICGRMVDERTPNWVTKGAITQLNTLLSIRYGKEFKPMWENTTPELWTKEWPSSGVFVIQAICQHWAEDMRKKHGKTSTIDDWSEDYEDEE